MARAHTTETKKMKDKQADMRVMVLRMRRFIMQRAGLLTGNDINTLDCPVIHMEDMGVG